MSDKYIIENGQMVPCDDLMRWTKWYETADRTLGRTEINDVVVSTVFLGLNHNFTGIGEPVLFETMVFAKDDAPNPFDDVQVRYSTIKAALAGHNEMVGKVTRELAA